MDRIHGRRDHRRAAGPVDPRRRRPVRRGNGTAPGRRRGLPPRATARRTMNEIVTLLRDSADWLAAGTSPDDVASNLRLKFAELREIDIDLDDAVAWLHHAARLGHAFGLGSKAQRLHEAATVLQDGGIVPRQIFVSWIDSLPQAKASAQPAFNGPIAISSMPARVTRRVVKRDEQNRIVETIDVEEDLD